MFSLNWTRRVLTIIAGVMVLGIGQSSAMAVTYKYYETVSGTPSTGGCGDMRIIGGDWGEGCYVSAGDVFWIYDRAADGMSVAIWYKVGSEQGIVRDKLGQGKNTIRDLDFPEGETIYLKVGRCNQTATNDCRQSGDYSNWTQSYWINGTT
jgi:hypothetical protein